LIRPELLSSSLSSGNHPTMTSSMALSWTNSEESGIVTSPKGKPCPSQGSVCHKRTIRRAESRKRAGPRTKHSSHQGHLVQMRKADSASAATGPIWPCKTETSSGGSRSSSRAWTLTRRHSWVIPRPLIKRTSRLQSPSLRVLFGNRTLLPSRRFVSNAQSKTLAVAIEAESFAP